MWIGAINRSFKKNGIQCGFTKLVTDKNKIKPIFGGVKIKVGPENNR
jgi:hypothetical protein